MGEITIEVGGSTSGDEVVEFTAPVADEREAFNLDAFALAQRHSAVVDFRYAKGDGSVVEDRALRPQAINKLRDGNVLIVGYDGDREDVRTYRLDRVRGYVAVSA